MKIYNLPEKVTALTDEQKSGLGANLDYDFGLNKECVDLKYIPRFFDYGLKAEYILDAHTYQLTVSNVTYKITANVKNIYLPKHAEPNSIITIASEVGWDQVKIYSVCNDLYINDKVYGFLEFLFCAGQWVLTKKGSYYDIDADSVTQIVVRRSESTQDVEYAAYLQGYGYFTFADAYELYSAGDPPENQVPVRYQNNVITFEDVHNVLGPVLNITTTQTNSTYNFLCWNVFVNGVSISDSVQERLRFVYDKSYLFFIPPNNNCGFLRGFRHKFKNTVSGNIDALYTLPENSEILEVYNITKSSVMLRDVDYTLSAGRAIVPTLVGRIYHLDEISIKFRINLV